MRKVLFFDLNNDGHHWFYNSNIMSQLKYKYKIVYYTNCLDENKKAYLNDNNIELYEINKKISTNKIIRNLQIYKIINKIKSYAKDYDLDLIVFLHLDAHIISMPSFWNSKINTLSVLHWLPKHKIKNIILKKYLKNKNNYLVVHDDIIKERLSNSDENIKVIYYPITDIAECSIKDLEIKTKKEWPTLLAFGGTRYDKGLDILLESLKNIKYNCNLIIAGKEETFKKDYIYDKISEIDKTKINFILDLNYITDEKMSYYFNIADIVVLPYRKMFMGQSGPLTEGIKNGCIIVAPDWFVLGETVKKYDCGILFEPENKGDLARAINEAIKNLDVLKIKSVNSSKKFKKERSIEIFRNKYESLIKEVLELVR